MQQKIAELETKLEQEREKVFALRLEVQRLQVEKEELIGQLSEIRTQSDKDKWC